MDKTEAFELKAKYGDEAFYLALDILEKQRIILTHTMEINRRKTYIEANETKIRKLKEKLGKACTENAVEKRIRDLENRQLALTWKGKPLINWIDSMDSKNPENFSIMVDLDENPEIQPILKEFVELEKQIQEAKKC